MRRVTLDRPFTQGMVTDVPAYALGPQHSALAQDGYSPQGVFRQRGGWAYYGTTADVVDNLTSVFRGKFILADVTRTITGDDDGDLFIHNASSAGTSLLAGTVEYLPRCVYRDEVIFCAQDGLSPLRRYSGAAAAGTASDAAGTTTEGEATITAINYTSLPDVGAYVSSATLPGSRRILSRAATTFTLDDMRAATAKTLTIATSLTGSTAPVVAIYSAGSATESGGTVTGYGTQWTSDLSILAGADEKDAMLIVPPSGTVSIRCAPITSVSSDTVLAYGTSGLISTKSPYSILRQCPFKDSTGHKGSLCGTGVVQYPSRVYFSPPDWHMGFHPGFVSPTSFAEVSSDNANDFMLDFIDIPSAYDGDDNVAIISSPNPLLVLKRNAVYGVYGSFPNYSVDMIADGIGCIDIRSAQSFDEGQFWAGEGGVYWYTNGQIVDLTGGRINREWRALTRDFDYGTLDYCSVGLSQGHLVVHITTGGGTTQRTYLCDLRDRTWQSRISNFNPRHMFTSRLSGEAEKLLAVSNDRQGRILDFAPALNGAGTAKDAAGTGPRLQFRTGTGIARANGIEGITNLVDLDVHANVVDAGAPGATVLSMSTAHGGGTSNQADATKTLSAINSDATDRIDRKSYRIGRKGRMHQVIGEVTTLGTDTAATKVEVHEIVATFRDGRGRS